MSKRDEPEEIGLYTIQALKRVVDTLINAKVLTPEERDNKAAEIFFASCQQIEAMCGLLMDGKVVRCEEIVAYGPEGVKRFKRELK